MESDPHGPGWSVGGREKNRAVDFIAMRRHLCYKVVQYRVSRCSEQNSVELYKKITQICSDVLKI